MAYVDQYTTIAGDMFDLISFKVYGSEEYADILMRANPDYKDVVIFDGGVQLVCPDIDVQQSDPLPPWRE
jgi:phage tail protein X